MSLLLLVQSFLQPLDVVFLGFLREGFVRLEERSAMADLKMKVSAPFA